MFGKIVLALSALALARAQIPSLGWCPEYVPMANFDMNRFLGVWYEAERYFQLSEVVSRCVMANYTKTAENKYRVSNEVTNRFTGIKRVLEGDLRKAETKAEEGKLLVKYTTIPLIPETKYSVLETDYNNYAVLWSCSGIGPVHTQNAWLMTRQRIPPSDVLQKAYGVLDKYKISKTFFVKTDQADCTFLDTKPTSEKPAESTAQTESETTQVVSEEGQNLRSAITPDTPEVILLSKKTEEPVLESKPLEEEIPDLPIEAPEEPVKIADEKQIEKLIEKSDEKPVEPLVEKSVEEPSEQAIPTIESVPERILKVAGTVKDEKLIVTPTE